MSIFHMFLNSDAQDYHDRLNKYLVERPNADTLGKKECQRSGHCCLKRPSSLTKKDLTRLAKHFGLDEKSFFQQYCMVDEFKGDYVIILKRHHQSGGSWVTTSESWSAETPCVFYENHACLVHNIKPVMCAESKCWDPGDGAETLEHFTRDELGELGWDGEE